MSYGSYSKKLATEILSVADGMLEKFPTKKPASKAGFSGCRVTTGDVKTPEYPNHH